MRFLAVLLATLTTLTAPPSESGPDYVPGRFVVVEGSTDAARGDVTATGHVVLESSGEPVEEARRLSEELGVTIEPMVMYRMLGDPVREPLFPEQWSLRNTGQTGGTAGADIAANGAWRWTTGDGAIIAVVDSGVEPTNSELAPNLWVNPDEVPSNGVDDDGNGFVDDTSGWDFVDDEPTTEDVVGHGTAVASIAAAAADGAGMVGVAPDATIMPLRACATFGCPADLVADAIVYAADNGADVINVSLGAPGVEPLVSAAVAHAMESGALVVAAAGNSGDDIDVDGPWTPVSIDGVLGVAWTTAADTLAPLSNRGVNSVDVAAPGDLILGATPDGGHDVASGTSFAAPHVAGIAALMIQASPDLTADEIAELIETHGTELAALEGAVASGRRVSATEAVQAATFRDIPGTLFADDVMWAVADGVTRGCTPTLFCPDAAVTRGQMAAFLVRALALPPTDVDHFDDDDDSVFADDIDRLAAAGITTGCSADTFCPDDLVTRAQMAALLRRAFGLPAAPSTFADDDGSIFEADIAALAAAGITRGCNPPTNDAFCPEDPVLRGQIVAFLRRAGVS